MNNIFGKDLSLTMYGLAPDTTEPSLIEQKQAKIADRTALKQARVNPLQSYLLESQGFNEYATEQSGVLKSVYDADTYTMQGDPTSTRAFGIDAYESTKTGDWFNNP